MTTMGVTENLREGKCIRVLVAMRQEHGSIFLRVDFTRSVLALLVIEVHPGTANP